MARLGLLPAVLLLSLGLTGCGSADVDPLPVLPCLWLQPARFVHYSWNVRHWSLLSGKFRASDPDDITLSELDPSSRGECWWTLYDGTFPKFQLQERPEEIRIFQLKKDSGTSAYATIPLPLRPGLTWTSVRQEPEEGQEVSASCSSERIQLPIGSEDTLRVDFSSSVGVLQSMWFSPTLGLVKWKGVQLGSLDRSSESAIEVQLEGAAYSYARYGRVDDDLRNAPTDCRAPLPPKPRTSVSRDEATHGRKQYFLYAKDRLAYLRARDLDQPDGLVIVKESWIPGETRTKGPLFLMMKSQGDWIYATATADGRSITASGKLASCMECHESKSTHDRMFGLQPGK